MVDLPHPGPVIQAARERREWSREELAARAGTSAVTIWRIETRQSRGGKKLPAIAEALEIDPALVYSADVNLAPPEPLVIENTIEGEADVRGPLAGRGAKDDDTADIASGLVYTRLHRSAGDEPLTTTLAWLPDECDLALLRVPVEVRIGGEIFERFAPGWVFVVDAAATPQDNDLVVVERAARGRRPGRSELRRFEIGTRGVRLLFKLTSDDAVMEDQGWRIVGVVVDKRPPQRTR